MKKKIIVAVCLVSLLSILISGCGSKESSHKMSHSEFTKKVDYLYEVTYNDYDWDDVTKWSESYVPKQSGLGGFGCSAVHNGNFYGRSFDFFFTDMCEFVVRTPHTDERAASIGVSISNANTVEDQILNQNGKSFNEFEEELIPFSMVDGINEYGVVCNTNVVPASDLIANSPDGKYHTRGTNPGKEDLFYQFMPRFVLDNAKSAKEAIELLKERNITSLNSKGEVVDYFGVNEHGGLELHMMVADKEDTFIVELVDNEMRVIKSGANMMTNFYISNLTPHGMGYDRYKWIYMNYEKTNTFEGMMDVVKGLKFSTTYDRSNPKNLRWDEVSGNPMMLGGEEGIMDCFNLMDIVERLASGSEEYSDAVERMNEYLDSSKAIIDSNDRSHGSEAPWISTHAEVYDIQNRTLYLMTQENYDRVMEFTY